VPFLLYKLRGEGRVAKVCEGREYVLAEKVCFQNCCPVCCVDELVMKKKRRRVCELAYILKVGEDQKGKSIFGD
jgi:hypothetical protein